MPRRFFFKKHVLMAFILKDFLKRKLKKRIIKNIKRFYRLSFNFFLKSKKNLLFKTTWYKQKYYNLIKSYTTHTYHNNVNKEFKKLSIKKLSIKFNQCFDNRYVFFKKTLNMYTAHYKKSIINYNMFLNTSKYTTKKIKQIYFDKLFNYHLSLRYPLNYVQLNSPLNTLIFNQMKNNSKIFNRFNNVLEHLKFKKNAKNYLTTCLNKKNENNIVSNYTPLFYFNLKTYPRAAILNNYTNYNQPLTTTNYKNFYVFFIIMFLENLLKKKI
jgi:hypothetical protein